MECLPVVEVVEVDGVLDFAGISDVAGAEDGGAGLIGVVVSGDGAVEGRDGGLVKAAALFLKNPGFELRVGGFGGGDVGFELDLVDAQSVEDHLVIPLAAAGVVGMQFASCCQGAFLPEAGEVKDAEGAGDAGTDQWNEFAHGGFKWV